MTEERKRIHYILQIIKKMTSWTVDEVCNWLSNLSLEQYCESFRENAIDGTELFNMTAETLANDLCIGKPWLHL